MKEGRKEGWKEVIFTECPELCPAELGPPVIVEEGRKDGRKEGWKEGRKEGRKGGREEGRKEGRKQGRRREREREVRKEQNTWNFKTIRSSFLPSFLPPAHPSFQK
jgi:hypothetical protein